MRKHPLLAFATAVSTTTLTLSATMATAQAAIHHPVTISATRAAQRHRAALLRHRAHVALVAKHHAHASPGTKRHSHARVVASLTAASLLRPGANVKLFVPLQGSWEQLRVCESGGNYLENTGNGYYGAYQFSLSTWQGLGLSGLPSQASPGLQDQAAVRLQRRSGWGSWPM